MIRVTVSFALCVASGPDSLLRFISLLLYFANLLSAKCILIIYYP